MTSQYIIDIELQYTRDLTPFDESPTAGLEPETSQTPGTGC